MSIQTHTHTHRLLAFLFSSVISLKSVIRIVLEIVALIFLNIDAIMWNLVTSFGQRLWVEMMCNVCYLSITASLN